MKISVITLLGSMLFMTACVNAQNSVSGNKDYQTKEISVENFTGIALTGSHDVLYTQSSGKPSLEIFAPSNIIPLIETYVKDDILVIKYKSNKNIRFSGKVEIRVSGPALSQIKVNGSGDINLVNGINTRGDIQVYVKGSGDIKGKKIDCNHLFISVNGSGDIDLRDITADVCEAKVKGSGDINLTGKTMDAKYNVNGSGDIDAKNLKAANVSAYVNGSGDIKCHATSRLTGKVNGSGDVYYRGNPEIEFSKKGLHKL